MLMKTVAVFEAKSRLSEILSAVEHGEEYTVTKRGAPIARIIPARQIDPASMAEAQELIVRIKTSRKGSRLSEEEYHEAVEEGRD
jgi:prevent-host-death family protein